MIASDTNGHYGNTEAQLGKWVAKTGKCDAKLGRWVAKLGRWVAKRGRWVAKLGRWVAKLVAHAPACYGSSLGSNPDISKKYKIVDISKGMANIKNTVALNRK